jgi:hypothetical protein
MSISDVRDKMKIVQNLSKIIERSVDFLFLK